MLYTFATKTFNIVEIVSRYFKESCRGLDIQGISSKNLEPNISVICQRIFMKFKMQIF
jgi:hypothetical protein